MARVATAVRRYEAAAAETCGRLRAALVVCASALTDAAAVETAEEPPGLAVETAAKVALTLRLTDALAKAATADRPLCLDLSALGLNDAVCVGVAQRLGKGADKMCAQDAWAAAGGSLALKNKHLNVGAPPVVRKFDERRPCAFHGGPALRPPADFVARLVLRGNDLGDVAARALAAIIEKMPRLLLLDLRDNPSITAAGRGALEAAVRRNASVVNVSVADGAALSGEGGIVAGWREQSAASAAGDALQALPFVDDADGKFAAVPPDKRPLVVDLRRSRDLEPADGGTRRFRPLAAAMLALRPATAAALAAAAQGQDTAALAAAARGQDKAQEAWLAHLTAPAARAAPRAVRRASRPSVDEAATRADKFRRSIEASSRQSSRQPAHRRSAPSFEIRTTARTLSLSASDPGFRVKLHSKNYAKKKLRARQPAMATLADDEGPLEIRDAEPPSRHRSAIHVIQ
ncbi:hypothetical protein M885DRAFT_525574 [Pelagophyceae sp. CCMP2097]|nr:hypothetical protein M885DRAFT_525574 [Pelagophyceae sp. CCMP2097]